MDELEVSKIFGAGCAALLAFVGLGQLGKMTVSMHELDEPAYIIEIASAEDEGEVEIVERMPIGQLMALASVDEGAKVFNKCSACHKADAGASNGVGPQLHAVVGREIGGVDGYSYSNVLAEMGGVWDFAALDGFLEDPKGWAPGTKMGFKGISKEEDRASVIAWLNEQSPSPLPMPAVEEESAEAPAAEEAPVEVAAVEEAPAVEAEAEVVAEEVEMAEAAKDDDVEVKTARTEEEKAQRVGEGLENVTVPESSLAEIESDAPAEAKAEEVAEVKTEEAAIEEEKPEAVEMAMAEPEAAEPAAAEEAEPVAEEAAAPAAAQVAAAGIPAFMAGVDASKGKKVFNRCKACHKVDAGAGNGVGPNLHGVVGRDIAALGDFKYSDALMGKDGAWDFEALNGFLEKPKDWAPGTKMSYGGLRKEEDRAALIAWLNEQSDNPLPLE